MKSNGTAAGAVTVQGRWGCLLSFAGVLLVLLAGGLGTVAEARPRGAVHSVLTFYESPTRYAGYILADRQWMADPNIPRTDDSDEVFWNIDGHKGRQALAAPPVGVFWAAKVRKLVVCTFQDVQLVPPETGKGQPVWGPKVRILDAVANVEGIRILIKGSDMIGNRPVFVLAALDIPARKTSVFPTGAKDVAMGTAFSDANTAFALVGPTVWTIQFDKAGQARVIRRDAVKKVQSEVDRVIMGALQGSPVFQVLTDKGSELRWRDKTVRELSEAVVLPYAGGLLVLGYAGDKGLKVCWVDMSTAPKVLGYVQRTAFAGCGICPDGMWVATDSGDVHVFHPTRKPAVVHVAFPQPRGRPENEGRR